MVFRGAVLFGCFQSTFKFLDHASVSHLAIVVGIFDFLLTVADVYREIVIDVVIRPQPLPILAENIAAVIGGLTAKFGWWRFLVLQLTRRLLLLLLHSD